MGFLTAHFIYILYYHLYKLSSEHLRKVLNLEEEWYKKQRNMDEAFNFIRSKIESKGILVMINGV